MGEYPSQHVFIEPDRSEVIRALLDGDEIGESMAKVLRRHYEIDNAALDRAAGHRGIFSLLWVLHQNDAAGFLHRAHSNGTVRASSAKDDRKSGAKPFGERTQ